MTFIDWLVLYLNLTLYPMIFKRKSFHLFRNFGDETISNSELEEIYSAYKSFATLIPEIKTEIKIVSAAETTCARGAEYCILLYSENKNNYLANIGYLGEQLDLYLVSKNIGSLWFGIGKPDVNTYHGLDFVIMIAIRRIANPTQFRKDMFRSKRKAVSEIWKGPEIEGVTNIVRFAPSACNTQPWLVENSGTSLLVYRMKPCSRGIMPASKLSYYNRIDMGIFLCFLHICLEKANISYQKSLFLDDGADVERTLFAKYTTQIGGDSE